MEATQLVQSPPYGMAREVSLSYEQAVERITATLQEQGFGILTEIDVKATLKKKLDKDFTKYIILGACNPNLAIQALTEDIGLLNEAAAALAVGFGIVLMGLTDTEHPPAAGTALGLAIVDLDATLLLVLATSVIVLVATQQLLLPRLRDLL